MPIHQQDSYQIQTALVGQNVPSSGSTFLQKQCHQNEFNLP